MQHYRSVSNVCRNTCDDAGSLVSMDSVVEEEEDRAEGRVSSPAGIVSHPLVEEATLALLPDRSATC